MGFHGADMNTRVFVFPFADDTIIARTLKSKSLFYVSGTIIHAEILSDLWKTVTV
jgi:hypothetical protein